MLNSYLIHSQGSLGLTVHVLCHNKYLTLSEWCTPLFQIYICVFMYYFKMKLFFSFFFILGMPLKVVDLKTEYI